MLPEPKDIESLSRFLCRLDARDPDSLREGDMCFHSSFDEKAFDNAEYECLFVNNPDYGPDGYLNDNPAMFLWRDYVRKAIAVKEFFEVWSSADNTDMLDHASGYR